MLDHYTNGALIGDDEATVKKDNQPRFGIRYAPRTVRKCGVVVILISAEPTTEYLLREMDGLHYQPSECVGFVKDYYILPTCNLFLVYVGASAR